MTDSLRSKFYQRINDQYAGQKNFYALAYDQDEVIDSVSRLGYCPCAGSRTDWT
jgi:hypothetical protein